MESFTTIVANGDQSTNQVQALDTQSQLWEELNNRVLVSGSILGGKYDSLFKSLQQCGGNKELEDDIGGNKDEGNEADGGIKEKEEVLASQRVSE